MRAKEKKEEREERETLTESPGTFARLEAREIASSDRIGGACARDAEYSRESEISRVAHLNTAFSRLPPSRAFMYLPSVSVISTRPADRPESISRAWDSSSSPKKTNETLFELPVYLSFSLFPP